MQAAAKRTITLPVEQAKYVDELVAKGAYASTSDVITAGLEALRDREVSLERWLREDVVPVYDAMKAHPERGLSPDAVLEALETHHAARLRAAKRGV